MSTQGTRLQRARGSLDGLSVGDAFGQLYFMDVQLALDLIGSQQFGERIMQVVTDDEIVSQAVGLRWMPPRETWLYTDDTQMALSIYECLAQHGEIEPDALARAFSQRYAPERGYGLAMHKLLPKLQTEDWRVLAPQLFDGGSFGNGAAMRVAPIGAYFADDLDAVIENARRSALVTHAHEEGVAGAIAVAVAAAIAWRSRDDESLIEAEFLKAILPHVPESEVKRGIEKSLELAGEEAGEVAAELLGSGEKISAQDTVPFCLWCAAQYPDHYEEALWLTLSGLGDRDTTCAIVGGIVAMNARRSDIPANWMQKREPLPLETLSLEI